MIMKFIYSGALLIWGVLVLAKIGSAAPVVSDKYSWTFLLVCLPVLYVLWDLASDKDH